MADVAPGIAAVAILEADIAAPREPRPVQLLYEFQTRGVVTARATETTRDMVRTVVINSKLYSRVEATPVEGRRLVITINNVPVTSESDAKAKGFVTGLQRPCRPISRLGASSMRPARAC